MPPDFGILFRTDKDRAAIRGGDVGFGQQAADGAGIAVIGQPLVGRFLPGMVLGDGKGHQLVKRQIAVAIDLHQLGRDRAQAQALPHHMRRHAEPGGDFLRAKTAFLRQLLERLELVGGMHVLAGDVFVEADFVRIVRGIDDAADRLGLLDLLALDPQKLRQPAAFADGDEIEPGRRAVRIQFRLDDKVLQNALGGDAGRIGLDRRLAVRRLAGVVRGLLELVERNETLAFRSPTTISTCLADMIDLLLGLGCRAHLAPAPLPVGETGVARARAAGAEGDHPACTSGFGGESCSVLESARKVGETAPAGPGSSGTSPLPARGRSP